MDPNQNQLQHRLYVAEKKIAKLTEVAVRARVLEKERDAVFDLLAPHLTHFTRDALLPVINALLTQIISVPDVQPPRLSLVKATIDVNQPPTPISPNSRLTSEIARFKEEAQITRQNLQTILEVKEKELESLQSTNKAIKAEFDQKFRQNKQLNDHIAFLENELSIRKVEVERLNVSNRLAQEEILTLKQATLALPPLAASASTECPLTQDRQEECEASFDQPLPASPRSAPLSIHKHILSLYVEPEPIPRQISESFSSSPPSTEPIPVQSAPLQSAMPSSSSSNSQAAEQDLRSQLQKVEAVLRAKNVVIEKLNRRIRNLESEDAIDVTVKRMAEREARFEREIGRLRLEIERVRCENSRLKVELDAYKDGDDEDSTVSAIDFRYLQRVVPQYLLFVKRGEQRRAIPLLPVICALLRVPDESCRELLAGQKIPLPRKAPF